MTTINKFVMKGFKSFANKTELIFGPNFNCVIGPNGAGKSNIMDALCFVLGKGSAKGLRAEKSANLIYNGGKKKDAAKEGMVSIHFDNIKRSFPINEDEVSISRTIKPSGQSIYKINDKKATRVQVLDLLAAANLNPDGYNIVLQGDIIRIVEMNPTERRGIVEDIAGISIYEEKKHKTLKELEKVEEKLNEADIILKEREIYLKDLKKDRDQALKYKDVAEDLQRSKATLNHLQTKQLKEKEDKIIKEQTEHSLTIKKLDEEINKLKDVIEDTEDKIKAIKKEIEEKGETEQIQVMKDIENLRVDIATKKNKIESHKAESEKLVLRKKELEESLKELEDKSKEMAERKELLDKNDKECLKNIALFESKIKDFKKKHGLDSSEEVELDLDNLDKEIEKHQTEVVELRGKQQEIFREKDRLELYYNSVDEKIKKVLELKKENKLEIEQLQQMRIEFKKTTVELNKLLNDDSSFAAQLGTAKSKLTDREDKHSKLNAKNNLIRQKFAENMAVKSIIDSKDKFGMVYGIVSDLGSVSSKYALAMEIAAGQKTKSIVVDNDKTASDCIKYLKKNRLGSATFIPLNKINSKDEDVNKDVLKSTGVVGLATDLIKCDPKFKKVFSYVFGTTLVIDNIDVARRVGIGTIRMSTIDGDLVEKSGAMHGGYRERQKTGGFQEEEVTKELEELEKEISDIQGTISSITSKRTTIDENITKLREFKANLEGEIIKKERSLHLEEGDIDANQKEKKGYQDNIDRSEKEAVSINTKIAHTNEILKNLQIKKQQLKNKIAEFRNPRIVAELNTFEEKKTELKDVHQNYAAELKTLDMQFSNVFGPEKDKIIRILSQHKREEEKFKEEIISIEESIDKDNKTLKEREIRQKEFYGKYKTLYDNKEKLTALLQKTETDIIKKEERTRTIEHSKNRTDIDVSELRLKINTLEDEFRIKFKETSLFNGKDPDGLKKDIWSLEKKMSEAGNINMRALEIYDQIKEEYDKLTAKKDQLNSEKQEVLLMINEIETKKKDLFMTTFDNINDHFQKMFEQLITKGHAYLELENKNDPFEGGLSIKCKMSGKKYLDIRSLSGGEKTLTALSFIFAIQEFEPAPFYVLDEVDAALDKRNAELLADFVKKYSGKAQYIMISHNDGVIGAADTLYGVSMDKEHGISKVVSIEL